MLRIFHWLFAKDFKPGLIILAIKHALVFINDNTVHILLNAHVINYYIVPYRIT